MNFGFLKEMILVWLIIFLFPNIKDLKSNNIYWAGAESIAHRFSFDLKKVGEKDKIFNLESKDVFEYKEMKLPNKQPGIFYLLGFIYKVLEKLKISFSKYYTLAALLLNLFSIQLLWAFLVTRFRRSFFEEDDILGGIISWGLIFGTLLWPYTRIPQQDAFASGLLFWALMYYFEGKFKRSSFLLGLTFFFSLVPTVPLLIFYFITFRNHFLQQKRAFPYFLLGLLPLIVHNIFYYQYPWIQANMAAQLSLTFPTFSKEIMIDHLKFYFIGPSALWWFVPVIIPATVYLLMDMEFKEALTLFPAAYFHFIFLLFIPTVGDCQYGPRYMLPAVVMLWFGFVKASGFRKQLAFYFLIPSIWIQSMGLQGGLMFCEMNRWAPYVYFKNLLHQ